MSLAFDARKLADYIVSLESFEAFEADHQFCYEHIGALFTNVILQAGLNYNTVVRPRVQQVLINYPEAYTTQRFNELVCRHGLETLIRWSHPVKIARFLGLLDFAFEHSINTCADLKGFLIKTQSREKMLELNGIGLKTVDYTLKLLNFDTVAVDRHIYSFVELADIKRNGYLYTKRVVEYAADFLNISRSAMDNSIWRYMSGQNRAPRLSTQYEFTFDCHFSEGAIPCF